MDRRQYLRFVAGAVSGLAGCATGHPPGGSDTTATPTGASIEVGLETFRYLVWSYAKPREHRTIRPDEITPVTEVPEPLRSVLRAATTGGYETDEVSLDLLAAIDRFREYGYRYHFEPYVSLDGTPHAFDPSVPVFTAHLGTAVEDPPPERTVGYDDLDGFPAPVRDFVWTIGAGAPDALSDEYRISIVPDAVSEFLDRYDYVGGRRIVTEWVDPGPPYTIEVRELTTDDLWGRPILAAESLPADLRRFVEDVVASARRALVYSPEVSEYRTDEIPASYFERLDTADRPYVDLGGTVYEFQTMEIHRDLIPVAVSAATAGPRSFTVAVEPSEAGPKPAVEGSVEFESAGALPSVLWVETESDRYLLDSDAYGDERWRESGAVERRVRNVAHESVVPGTPPIEATYAVPEAIPAGRHRAWGLVEVKWTAASDGRSFPALPYPFQVVVTVPEG